LASVGGCAVMVFEYKGNPGAEVYQKTSSSANTIKLLTLAAAINPELAQNPISIYPNPASDLVNIDLGVNDKAEVSIFNLNGENVLTTKFYGRINKISMSNLAKGVYTVQIEIDRKCVNSILIVQ